MADAWGTDLLPSTEITTSTINTTSNRGIVVNDGATCNRDIVVNDGATCNRDIVVNDGATCNRNIVVNDGITCNRDIAVNEGATCNRDIAVNEGVENNVDKELPKKMSPYMRRVVMLQQRKKDNQGVTGMINQDH